MPVTQFNMKWVEPAGLVKFDFLGLKTLTVLDLAVKLLKQRGVEVDLAKLPLDDRPSFEMLAKGDVVGVFQVESQGMRRALVDMRPDRFEDIIALVALYRPGPMANIPTYCARKHGDEEPEYLHPMLEPILKETFGVIIYQEQVMQIAQVMAGYSLGQADLLRRAMGKKIRSEMEKQRAGFIFRRGRAWHRQGTGRHDFRTARQVRRLRLQQESRGGLRAGVVPDRLHEGALSGRVHRRLDDARHEQHRQAVGVSRRGPAARHQVRGPFDQSVRPYLHGQRQHDLLRAVCAERCRRTGGGDDRRGAQGRRVYVAGGFRLAGLAARHQQTRGGKPCRRRCVRQSQSEPAQRCLPAPTPSSPPASAITPQTASGQNDMFGGMADAPSIILPAVEPWLPAERLRREYDAIGFFLSGHPLDDYAVALKRLRVQSWNEFSRAVKTGATAGRVAATVVSRMERRTKTGNKMGIMGLSDPTGHFEAVLFSEGLAQYRDVLEPGTAVLLQLGAELQGEDVRARILHAEPLDAAAAKTQKGLRIFVRDREAAGVDRQAIEWRRAGPRPPRRAMPAVFRVQNPSPRRPVRTAR